MMNIKETFIVLLGMQFAFNVICVKDAANGTLVDDIAQKLLSYQPSQENITNIAAQESKSNNNTSETDEGSVNICSCASLRYDLCVFSFSAAAA
ncbi:hypothetical protein CRE_00577 [Caenorhabditis remanei]|uniref:Uncharacterized protein n=1 Tax=Caenorhabditis remanei TaxID=31234 RepID=E3LD82_CAERE|nr:hypothetical protein CRE_00577 [Caenorhabditis remanei]